MAEPFREHVLCYVAEGRQRLAFVWAREQDGKKRPVLRNLPFERETGARTTVEQLAKLQFKLEDLGTFGYPGLTKVTDRLNAAFDVEHVTKRFFKEYEAIFKQAEAQITGVEGEAKRLFTQKVFNRLLFIRFLEKKG